MKYITKLIFFSPHVLSFLIFFRKILQMRNLQQMIYTRLKIFILLISQILPIKSHTLKHLLTKKMMITEALSGYMILKKINQEN